MLGVSLNIKVNWGKRSHRLSPFISSVLQVFTPSDRSKAAGLVPSIPHGEKRTRWNRDYFALHSAGCASLAQQSAARHRSHVYLLSFTIAPHGLEFAHFAILSLPCSCYVRSHLFIFADIRCAPTANQKIVVPIHIKCAAFVPRFIGCRVLHSANQVDATRLVFVMWCGACGA